MGQHIEYSSTRSQVMKRESLETRDRFAELVSMVADDPAFQQVARVLYSRVTSKRGA